jgi:hypothetical protein
MEDIKKSLNEGCDELLKSTETSWKYGDIQDWAAHGKEMRHKIEMFVKMAKPLIDKIK